MFEGNVIERKDLPDLGGSSEIYLQDPDTDRSFIKIVGGICPPNKTNAGYVVIAGLQHPLGINVPYIWMITEKSFNRIEEMLLAMSRCHFHYKVDNFYARFKRSKNDDRVYDDFLRHVQSFNLEAARQRRVHIQVTDAPWTNDRGGLKFILEKLRDELRIGNRKIWWDSPSPPSTRTLQGVDVWENVTDENTMLGAMCYALAGLLVDRPKYDPTGHIQNAVGTVKTKGKFDPYYSLHKMQRRKKWSLKK